MKHIILLVHFLFILICSYGQGKFGIKVYQNTDIFEVGYFESGVNESEKSNHINFNRLSIGISVTTKNNFTHEIELLIPEISKSINSVQFPMNYEFRKGDTFDGKISTYSIRYEMNKTFSNNLNRLAFNVGVGLNPYYVHIEYTPNTSTAFYFSNIFYGAALNFTPRINYKLSNRLILDLNIPLKIYDLRWEKTNIKNPSIPIRQQTVKDFDSIFFENAYTIRLGLMYTLN